MNDHLRILQQWVQTKAVCRSDAAGHDGERGRGEDQEHDKEDLDAGQDGGGVGRKRDVDLVAYPEHEAVGGEQPGPEKQRALLPGPERGELIGGVERAIGVMEDVIDGEIVGVGGPDQGERGTGESQKAHEPGTTGGFAEAIGGDGERTTVSRGPQSEAACEEAIDAESERQKQREAAECGHRMQHARRPSLPAYSLRFFARRGTAGGTTNRADLATSKFLRHIAVPWFVVPRENRLRLLDLCCRDTFGDEPIDAGQQVLWQQGLEPKVYAEFLVLFLGLGKSTDHKDGDVRVEAADSADEIGTVHAGHDVIGDGEIDGGGERSVAVLLQSALGAKNGDHEVAGSFENGLPGGRLHCIVVNQKNRCCHAVVRSWGEPRCSRPKRAWIY